MCLDPPICQGPRNNQVCDIAASLPVTYGRGISNQYTGTSGNLWGQVTQVGGGEGTVYESGVYMCHP